MQTNGATGAVGLQRVLADARRRGLALDIVSRAPAASLAEAAALLGIQPAEIVKTLVVRQRKARDLADGPVPGAYLFALVPGDRQVSWPRLRKLLQVNRLAFPDPVEALAATGYERGTITPLGSSTPWPVYADSRVLGRISIGAGEHGFSAFVDAGALLSSFEATVADITEPLAPR